MSRRLTPARVLIASAAALLLGVQLMSAPTLSGWTSGQVKNDTNSVRIGSGSQSLTHSYPTPNPTTTCGTAGDTTNKTCASTITPTTVSTAEGTWTAVTDTIRNNTSNAPITNTLSVPTCGPVKLSNQRGSDANPMLPRYNGWTYTATDPWGGTGAVTLDGTSAYATSLRSRPFVQPSASYRFAIGVWFKVANGSRAAMPLVTLSTEAVGNTYQAERTGLTMWETGILRANYTPYGSATSSNGSFNDGKWHFAYVVYATEAEGGIKFYMDGSSSNSSSGTYVDFSESDGSPAYWRIGRANDSFTGVTNNFYFKGSLSNVVIFSGATVPGAPNSTNLSSQAQFDTWAKDAQEHWKLNDPGTTIHTGTKPDWLSTSACDQVQMKWSATTPSITAVTKTLGGWSTPSQGTGPTGTLATTNPQASKLELSRITGFNANAAGLWLLPTTQMSHGSGTGWGQTFTWSSNPASARILIQ